MKISVLISSYNRVELFNRCIWSIANRPPSTEFEVIVVDDNSTEDTLSVLKSFSCKLTWKFIRFDHKEFEKQTGIKRFFNNPSVTNNIAFKHSSGDLIFQQGNEIIAYKDIYNTMIRDIPDSENFLVFSTTYDVSQGTLDQLDKYGTNITDKMVEDCYKWPLQSSSYRSDVTNYISLTPRSLWNAIGGYDERYMAGISSEDSDFVRRARALGDCKTVISEAISLHQFHGGKTRYYEPKANVVSRKRFDEGVAINHATYYNWNQKPQNPQKWPVGTYGIQEILTNEIS